ncbi:MAG: hypothetical protein Q9219_005990 [cf. Caloplaca sp. 3 TL-2023]
MTSTFHFRNVPTIELFVDTISLDSKSLLRQIHLTILVAKSYKGIRRPLIQTLNRLAPNPYRENASLNNMPEPLPNIRLRIQFSQYTTDKVFFIDLSPPIFRFISLLPAYLFKSILVIVPPLPPAPVLLPPAPYPPHRRVSVSLPPTWYTKVVPSDSLECLAKFVTDVMATRPMVRVRKRQGGVAKDGVRFLSFDAIKKSFADPDSGAMSPTRNLLAGMCTGVVASTFAVTPTERIKTALIDDARSARNFRSSFHAVRAIYQQYGLLGMYHGYAGTTFKQAGATAFRMGTYNILKDYQTRQSIEQTTFTNFANGAVAGTVTTYATQPFDTLKTRVFGVARP